jgi:protein-tyrosine phosphatase
LPMAFARSAQEGYSVSSSCTPHTICVLAATPEDTYSSPSTLFVGIIAYFVSCTSVVRWGVVANVARLEFLVQHPNVTRWYNSVRYRTLLMEHTVNRTETRRLAWEGGYNIRDIGVYLVDGQPIGSGKLVRADDLIHLTAAGRDALVEYGIRTVIDTRSAEERIEFPPAMQDHPAVATVHAPLARVSDPDALAEFHAVPDILHWNYLTLRYCGGQLAEVLRQVAYAPAGGTLIHCRVGKDRTGLSIAFILALLGVGREEIIADYTASAAGLEPLFEQWRSNNADQPERYEHLARLLTAHAETMEAVLDHIEERYGGMAAYLQEYGFGAQDIQALRERLL